MAEFKVMTGTDLKKLSRFSYVYVWEKRPNPKKDEKDLRYEVSVIIPKSAKADIRKINEAVEAAKKDGIERKVYTGKIIEKKFKHPLHDGDDEEREDDEAYHGNMYLSARSKNQPGIVDANADPIIKQSEFFSGCFGRASLAFYPYEVDGGQGVGVSIVALQKVKDGPSLGGSRSVDATKEFENFKVDPDDIDDEDMFS